MNAKECLVNVENLIREFESGQSTRVIYRGYWQKAFRIDDIYDECGIFDWWNDYLSVSQLKAMRTFLKQAIKLGFTGYVCFKVGAANCSHGMWAHKNESTDGYSPEGDCLFHSFRAGDNYFDMELDGVWMHDKYGNPNDPWECIGFNLSQIKAELAK